MTVNLAGRPFANTRPLRRAAAALWVLGVVLAGLAGWLYWQSLFGIEGKRAQIVEIERGIATERRRLANAESSLAGMDLRRQNTEASYLNARIGERTFPWSGLFEHLAQVLPRKVRLFSLAPQAPEQRGAGRRSRRPGSTVSGGRVYLQMTGAAESDEALTELLDRLFKDPWFASPSLPTEHRQEGVIQFVLGVYYLPGGPPTALAVRPPVAPAPRITEVPLPARSGGEAP
ncbi:MAG TPA: PilN domain-containing protein [Thermoanaerobaculia bacterium]|nr:PilN domain-containing protein [Thermoanaerobaculia bacterium]